MGGPKEVVDIILPAEERIIGQIEEDKYTIDGIDLKGEKKPVEYLDKIEKWLEFRNRIRDEDPDEFAKLTGELFTHLLAIRLAGVIVDHTCEYCDMTDGRQSTEYVDSGDETVTTPPH